MNERQYFAARETAKAEYEEKLRALDLAWGMLNKTSPPRQPTAAKRRPAVEGTVQPPLLTQALVAVLAEMPAEFDTRDIDKVLRAAHAEFADTSRSTITHTLRRLAASKSPPITIIEIGKGKRPTRYRKLLPGGAQLVPVERL